MPGTYTYPPPNPFQPVAPVPGTPEVFTGWFFFFNQPENCAVPNQCVPPPPGGPAPNDFTTGRGGVYNFAGHAVSGGGTLTLVGNISVGDQQFGGPFALEDPTAAEIHLAVAPHVVLVPELLPGQFRGPVTIRRALEDSLNVPAALVGQAVGMRQVVQVAGAMGIESRLAAVPSLALGTSEVTLLEMTTAFATL